MSMQIIFQSREIVHRGDDVFRSHGGIDFNQNGELDSVTLGDTERYLEPVLNMRALEELSRSSGKTWLSGQDLTEHGLSPSMVERTDRGSHVEYVGRPVSLEELPEVADLRSQAEETQAEFEKENPGVYQFEGPMQLGISVTPFGSRLEVYREVSHSKGEPAW